MCFVYSLATGGVFKYSGVVASKGGGSREGNGGKVGGATIGGDKLNLQIE